VRVERRAPAGLHLGGLAGDGGDLLDRLPEQVAAVKAVATAELAHRVAQLRIDERVDDHGWPVLGARDRQLHVVDRLHARMADDFELGVRKLRLERKHEPYGRLAGGVGDDVQLDDGRAHPDARVTSAGCPGRPR
jgi:hypothetical protein